MELRDVLLALAPPGATAQIDGLLAILAAGWVTDLADFKRHIYETPSMYAKVVKLARERYNVPDTFVAHLAKAQGWKEPAACGGGDRRTLGAVAGATEPTGRRGFTLFIVSQITCERAAHDQRASSSRKRRQHVRPSPTHGRPTSRGVGGLAQSTSASVRRAQETVEGRECRAVAPRAHPQRASPRVVDDDLNK